MDMIPLTEAVVITQNKFINNLPNMIIGAVFFVSTWFFLSGLRFFYRRILINKDDKFTGRVFIFDFIYTCSLFFVLFISLFIAGLPMIPLITIAGVFGIGLSMGLKSLTGNIISGAAILIYRSISIGDIISIDNEEGELTSVGMIFSTIKKEDLTEVIIPNNLLSSKLISIKTSKKKEI